MRIKLSIKLSGAFFLILTIVVGAMFFSRYLFARNFENYIHQMEAERLQRLVPALQAAYRVHHNWTDIKNDRMRWDHIMRGIRTIDRHDPPPPMDQKGPPGGPPRILLMDANQQPLFGTPGPGEQDLLIPIHVDGQNAMASTLEEFEKLRRQWLTDISHELRTPLSILRGEIVAIQDGVREPTPENLESLHAEILRIYRLVEDLHLLSVAESDMDNALKYVHSPGALEITGHPQKDHVVLYFQDSGPGVPPESLPRLFDRLYRVEPSRSRDTGGSGLGLSICRQIIEKHGGRIWAQAGTLGGLSIGIQLPMGLGQT